MLIVESKVMLIMMMLNGNVATTTREKETQEKRIIISKQQESENTVGSVERAGKHSMRETEREMERNNGISDENI